MHPRTRLVSLALVLLTGCIDPEDPARGRPIDAGPRLDAPGGVNYREHVAPILAEHCFHCHTDGAISGIVLDRFDDAVRLASRIAERTADRTMPPWYANNSGDCRTYEDANWLEDEELAILAEWAVSRAEGPTDVPIPPARTLRTLDRIDATVDIGTPYTPSLVGDDHDTLRCFVVDSVTPTDVFLTAYQVVPSEPRVVHHVILFHPDVEDVVAQGEALAAEDSERGWECPGGPRMAAHPIALWAPGGGATEFPAGTGVRIVGGRPLILQVHYNTVGSGPLPDLTEVQLRTETSVPSEAQILPVADHELALPPRMPSVSTTGSVRAPTAARIWGVFPHMHQRGLDLDVRATDGTEACLIDMTNWDFGWQGAYFFSEPQDIARGTRLEITCTYQTMEDSDVVTWGETTADEMCLSYVYATGR
jgi:hypothetical protein